MAHFNMMQRKEIVTVHAILRHLKLRRMDFSVPELRSFSNATRSFGKGFATARSREISRRDSNRNPMLYEISQEAGGISDVGGTQPKGLRRDCPCILQFRPSTE
jgi:hypothetical protein